MTDNTLPEKIAHQLRRDILRGKLPPGAAVKERDTALDMGVSRTPMREAIRILAKEGLVELRPSRSPVVARPGAKEVTDQAEVLIVLEKLSAELACTHATDAEIERIAAIVDLMARDFDSADPIDMFELDMSFHTAIADASHNRALADTHRSFMQRQWRARYTSAVKRRNRERVVAQHMAIVTALRARDPVATHAAIDKHLHRLAEDIREVILAEDRQDA